LPDAVAAVLTGAAFAAVATLLSSLRLVRAAAAEI